MKYTPPRIDKDASARSVAVAIEKIYRDINEINTALNAKVNPEANSDANGKPGMLRVLQDGDKAYLSGKLDGGWKNIEIIEDLSSQLTSLGGRITDLEAT